MSAVNDSYTSAGEDNITVIISLINSMYMVTFRK